MADELDPYLWDVETVVNAIIRAYRRTYAINVRRFDPKVGDDGHTFGSQNWRGGLFHLEKEFGSIVGVQVDRPNNHLSITLPNGVTLRPYRAHFAGENLAFFPTSATRAQVARTNSASYSFFEYSESFAADLLRVNELIIQHDGDQHEGLRAIYVGAPLDGQDPANGWFLSKCIYTRDTSTADDIDLVEENENAGTVPFTEQPAADVEILPADSPEEENDTSSDGE